jgi:hypothetical protein
LTDEDPILGPQRKALGERRLNEFLEHNATLQFMALALGLTIATVPGHGYSDKALECLKADAADLRRAADEYAAWTVQLAEDWRAQRQEPHA